MKARSAKAEWMVIPSLPDYEVSEFGDVRRLVASRSSPVGFTPKTREDRDGYITVHLITPKGGRPVWVHRLVTEAFIGPQPSKEKFQAQHKDGSRDNNHYTNLKWGTPQQNSDDMITHGTHKRYRKRGEGNPNAKLNWEQVREIRKKYIPGEVTLKKLGEEYDVCFQLISQIVNGSIWDESEVEKAKRDQARSIR